VSGGSWRGERIEDQTEKPLAGTGRWQRHEDAGLFLDDSGRQFDQVQAQRVELGAAPRGTLWTGRAERPPDLVGAAMQQ